MKYRKQFIIWLFNTSQKVYTKAFKNHDAWSISKTELLHYPSHTIGKHLGLFLDKNGFELIPKVERHDAYHTITGFGTNVEDEIALQYLCLGNGKRSIYLYGAILLGSIILPEYIQYYKSAFHIGKSANSFHHFEYSKLLNISIDEFRNTIFSKNTHEQLKTIKYDKIQSML